MQTSPSTALALLVCILLCVSNSNAQVSTFQKTRGREIRIANDPALRDRAARTGERVRIELDSPVASGVFEENVNVEIDCTPWLIQFPGGVASWFVRRLDPLTGDFLSLEERIEPEAGTNAQVTGQYCEILNITRTLVREAAQDNTAGIYRCEVCVPAEPVECRECHSSNFSLLTIGKPPILDKADNESEGEFGGNLISTLRDCMPLVMICEA